MLRFSAKEFKPVDTKNSLYVPVACDLQSKRMHSRMILCCSKICKMWKQFLMIITMVTVGSFCLFLIFSGNYHSVYFSIFTVDSSWSFWISNSKFFVPLSFQPPLNNLDLLHFYFDALTQGGEVDSPVVRVLASKLTSMLVRYNVHNSDNGIVEKTIHQKCL